MVEFFNWYHSLQVGPTIKDLRDSFESIRAQEVQKNLQRFRAEDRELFEVVTKQIVNKLLHEPMKVLREGTQSGNGESETFSRIQALRELFGIARSEKRSDDAS
jgi:glutamyl-tRNA reductase